MPRRVPEPLTGSLLLRRARLVPLGGSGPAAGASTEISADPVDLRITDGAVIAVAPRLDRRPGEDELDAAGRWAIPGLWDHHVHFTQAAQTFDRLDLTSARSAADALAMLRAYLAGPDSPEPRVPAVGFGFFHAAWPDEPTLTALDEVAAGRAVVLASNDVHSGWLSTLARELLGLPLPEDDDGLVREGPWFEALARLAEVPGIRPTAGYRKAQTTAAARGVVGITEMEWADNRTDWPGRVADGIDLLRVRTAAYPDDLDAVLAAGLRTGDPLAGGRGLLRMGPLKTISDGSLNTATAHTSTAYPEPLDPAHLHGVQNVAPNELAGLVRKAHAGGLEVAVHAIGDAAAGIALDAVGAAGARGSIEHAQLLAAGQPERMAALGVRASVQPAHLLDDRDLTEECWPGRAAESFPLRTLLDAGVRVVFGSDAPVARLHPWLTMAAAVHRSGDDRAPWHPEQQLTAAEALAASTDGQGTLGVGSRGDVVLLDADPFAGAPAFRAYPADPADTAAVAARLRDMPVAATILAGRPTHLSL
ncbi:amidohydrolase family protein [Georgenia halophila]|uniref:Amidohydrolase family protein n=1 Tax=Georgenia halophila TaxID=620889 RepID=A0ABP8KSH7_9MICO